MDDIKKNATVQLDELYISDQEDSKNTKVITREEIESALQETNEPSKTEQENDQYHLDFLKQIKPEEPPAPLEQPTLPVDEAKKNKGIRLYDDEEDIQNIPKEVELIADDHLEIEKKRAGKRNDLVIVGYDKGSLMPFKKVFYMEPKEIQNLNDEEIRAIRRKMGNVRVRGSNCPRPIMNWFQCGICDSVLEILEKKGCCEPFPIQSQALPVIMSGRDAIGIAETGSGKTLAYILPMIRHIMDQRPIENGEGPIAMILAPTRELTTQIYKEAVIYCNFVQLKCVCVYGGAGVSGQLSELKRGCEIVVCTPGRMIDVLTTSNGKITNLKRITYIVIDEADRMFDMGFGPQIAKIFSGVRPDKQCVMFSATFPRRIESVAKKLLYKPIEIVVGNRGQICSNVQQQIIVVPSEKKYMKLVETLGEWNDKGSILIFVEKQVDADHLFKCLFTTGFDCLVLHGGQDQADREFTILDFKNHKKNILIATSICARGLDIKSIILVVNYVCPNHMEDYIHRVGRTGRAGCKGTAITFITPDECQFSTELINAMIQSGQEPDQELLDLEKLYKEKIRNGEVPIFRPNGYVGSGFQFTFEEKEKIKKMRKELSKGYGIDEDLSENENDEEKEDEKKEEVSLAQKLIEAIKDPKVKQMAMDAATMAAKNAIIAGSTSEELMKFAQDAIKKVIDEHNKQKVQQINEEKVKTEAMSEAMSIKESFESKNNNNSRISSELFINDYPLSCRNQVIQSDFLESISEATGCMVSVRGVYIDQARKGMNGVKKQHIYIEGSSKAEVNQAYAEIKKTLEDMMGGIGVQGDESAYI